MNKLLLYNANVWNSDLNFTPDAWLFIEDGWIKDIGVGQYAGNRNDIKTIDIKNRYVLPGLINCHTHIFGSPQNPEVLSNSYNVVASINNAFSNLDKLLGNGVTYFRDVGCPYQLDIQLAELLNSGQLFGPEAIVSSTPLVMTGGHAREIGTEVDGEIEVRKQARKILKDGAGCLKVMATGGVSTDGETPHDVQLNESEMRAAVEEAHHKNKIVAAHAQGTEGIKNALRAGVDSIEHGIYLDDEAIELFLEKDAYLVPTLMAPQSIVEYGAEAGIPSFMVEKAKSVIEVHQTNIYKAYQAGVKIAMGTDAGTPFNLYEKSSDELSLMVNCGMSPASAIHSSTLVAAQLLNKNKTHGSIEKGYVADLIVLEDNPLDNIAYVKDINQVFKQGTPIKMS